MLASWLLICCSSLLRMKMTDYITISKASFDEDDEDDEDEDEDDFFLNFIN